MDVLRIGIVGAGHMGSIRARFAQADPQSRVVQVVDVVPERAQALASRLGCDAGTDWEALLGRRDVDAVVVATPHKYLAYLTIAALRAGKHVLCEKPMSRSLSEADQVIACHRTHRQALVVGFTLRHHPAIAEAWELLGKGTIGEPFYVRGHYGHGGRPGYDREWRADWDSAGGGELVDQGVHLIDLSRWFLGEFEEVTGFTSAYFWGAARSTEPVKADEQSSLPKRRLEDNAFVLLRTRDGRAASLHASWTQWRNKFSFEIYGRDGFLTVEGLGGSYGPERLSIGHRRPQGGPPTVEEVTFDIDRDGWWPEKTGDVGSRARYTASGDVQDTHNVWAIEWAAFLRSVMTHAVSVQPVENRGSIAPPSLFSAGPRDAREALSVVEAVYGAKDRLPADVGS